jgi:hypothetical protein
MVAILEMKKLKVYIASPYTNGSAADNVRRQLDAQKVLMDKGFVAFPPLITHFADIHHPRSEHEWFEWELEWLKTCDFLVRLRPTDGDGVEVPSKGSDIEEKTARENNMPVYSFKCVNELQKWLITKEEEDIIKDIEKNGK